MVTTLLKKRKSARRRDVERRSPKAVGKKRLNKLGATGGKKKAKDIANRDKE